MLDGITSWCGRNKLRLWFLGVCAIGFLLLAAFVVFIKPFVCSPALNEKWTANSYEYPYPQNYSAQQRGQIIATEKQKPSYTYDKGSHNKYTESAHEVVCAETKFTDLAIAFLTYCLVAVGWFTMKSADENTKRKERAYIVAVGIWGIPKESWKNTWEINNRAKSSMFHGPWRMALQNTGQTAGFTTKVEWGLCPRTSFDAIYEVAGNKICNLLDKDEFAEWRREWMRELGDDGKSKWRRIHIQDIFIPGAPIQYRHVCIKDRDKHIGEVFFGRICYNDVFGDKHSSAFALEVVEDHTNGINLSEHT